MVGWPTCSDEVTIIRNPWCGLHGSLTLPRSSIHPWPNGEGTATTPQKEVGSTPTGCTISSRRLAAKAAPLQGEERLFESDRDEASEVLLPARGARCMKQLREGRLNLGV